MPKESVFAELKASHTSEVDTVTAIADGVEPRNSGGRKVSRWTSRGQPGKSQWVLGRFAETRNIRSVGVYWMRDRDEVDFPQEWSLEVKRDGEWKSFELYTTDKYGIRANQYNVVHPAAPLKCNAIRM